MLDNNDCNSSNLSTLLLTVLTNRFSLLVTYLACADDLLPLSKECVVKLFNEACKLKHKPQWTSENRGLKSTTSNNLIRENTGDNNKK